MVEHSQTIMEEREELMISSKGGKPTKKIAHFIKPTFDLLDSTPNLPSISLPFRPVSIDCTFNGWKNPTKSWVSWVDRLHSSYQFNWKRSGIYEAILSSKYKIIINEDLFYSLAERWCCETNTFVFPWGEATISLEDVMVLGGYSVLEDSVSRSDNIDHFAIIEEKLIDAHKEMSKGPSQKASHGKWMKHFMENGLDTGIEHEAFLSCWLSRFVLPTFPYDVVVKKYFKIAIFLASGFQRSLAPAVLASIYRDLSLLKSAMVNSVGNEGSGKGDGFDDLVKVTVWAPLQLVQVWAWERFPEFRPSPVLVQFGEPRLARWHGVNESEIGNVRPLLQSAGHSFEWRPYCKDVDNLPLPMFYRECEEWVIMKGVLGDDVKSMVRFLRVCDLVGLETIEKYNPNRVAMQFGFDQDVPEVVKRGLLDSDIPKRELVQLAWINYTNPTKDETLYIPSKFYVPQVTLRYLNWLRQGVLMKEAAWDGVVRKKRSFIKWSREELRKANNAIDKSIAALDIDVKPCISTEVIGNDLDVPPGFPPKSNASSEKACVLPGLTQKSNAGHYVELPPSFMPKTVGNNFDVPLVLPRESIVACKEAAVPSRFTPISNVGNIMNVPPGFTPKSIGNNHSFPTGFPNKSYDEQPKLDAEKKDGYKLQSEVLVKEECIESSENRQQLLSCSYQTLYTPPVEIESRPAKSLKTESEENLQKSELVACGVQQTNDGASGEVAKNGGCGRDDEDEDQSILVKKAEIQEIDKLIANIEAESNRIFCSKHHFNYLMHTFNRSR
uniref:Aminotransferase-like plant mobile domain-containing protein n=1 Tax=Chenopodium quinoa TaxID=63459 RepID=A0A803LYE0_CHEQI